MSLAVNATRSAAWMTLMRAGTMGLGLVGTLLLIRYLSPLEYGEATAAALVVGSASQLSTFGVGQFVIVKGRARRDLTFHATAIHLALGLVALALVYLLRDALGASLRAPALGRYVPGLALAISIDRLALVPERILMRDMRFRPVAVARALGELGYTAASLAFGVAGWGGMAIVLGNLARSVLRGGVMIGATDRAEWLAPAPLRLESARALFRFGGPLWLASVCSYAARRWDNLLVSRYFGAGHMGAYNLAFNLAEAPANTVGDQLADVLLPSFTRIGPRERPAAFLRASALLALVSSPLAVGLAVVAPTLVETLLSPRWQPVWPMLAILSALSITRPPAWLASSYLQAANRPGWEMWLQLLDGVATLGAVALSGALGPLWLCAGVVVGTSARTLASAWVIGQLDGVPTGRFLLVCGRPLLACVPMAAMVLAVRALVDTHALPRGVGLGLEVTVGALAYAAAAFGFDRGTARDCLGLVRRALDRRRPAAPSSRAIG